MRDVRKIVRIVSCIMKRFLKLIIKKLYHWRIIIILLEIKITWRLWRKCWKSWERKIKINWRKMMKKKHWKIEGSFKDHERYGLESQYEINNCQQLSRKFPNLHNQQSIFKTFNSRMHQSLPEVPVCPSFLAESYQRIRPILDPIIVQWMKHLRLLTTLLSRYTVHH